MDNYNNNTPEGKAGIEPRERKQNYMRQYEREVEPCIKLSEKVMIPIKKYPKVGKHDIYFPLILYEVKKFC